MKIPQHSFFNLNKKTMKKLILFLTLCKVLINLSKSSTVHYEETVQQMNKTREQLFTLLISNNL